LKIASGGRLEGKVEALVEQFRLHPAGQVEALANRPRG
jgi:hypothetical protein